MTEKNTLNGGSHIIVKKKVVHRLPIPLARVIEMSFVNGRSLIFYFLSSPFCLPVRFQFRIHLSPKPSPFYKTYESVGVYDLCLFPQKVGSFGC
jgi:hypothetical protein